MFVFGHFFGKLSFLAGIVIFVLIAAMVSKAWAYPADNEWIVILRNGLLVQDPNGDAQGSRNVVSDSTHAAVFFANDGTNIYFRLRLDIDPSGSGGQGAYQSFGWGFEIDTNLDAGNYEWLIMLDGISRDENVSLQKNTAQQNLGDPSDVAEITVATYSPVTSYSRVVVADTSFNGNQDCFLDFFIPYSSFLAFTGLTANSPIRLFEGSSSSARALQEQGADLVGASDLYAGFSDYITPAGQIATTGVVRFVASLDGSGDVTQINAGDKIYIAVSDNDQNLRLNALDTVTITLTSASGDTETMTLTETGVNTGVFTASIPSERGTAVSGNGKLQVVYGDNLTATYRDAVDASGNINQLRIDTATVRTPVADLSVTKTVNNLKPNEGNTITYTIRVKNDGPNNATNIKLADQLPAGLSYVSHTADQGSYNSGYGLWTVGSLANAASATLTIEARVNAGTAGATIINTASITSLDEADPNNANNTAAAAITVQKADLAVSKTVSNSQPNEGNSITYTIVLTNKGPDNATNIVVTDRLPTGVSYASHTVSQGSYNSSTGVWNLVNLANGANATLAITATVNAGAASNTAITNTASITSVDQTDPDSTDNKATADITVGADLALSKTADEPEPNVGDTVTYTVTVTNNGPNDVGSVEITDLLPSGVTYVSHSALRGTYHSGTGVWSISGISNGTSVTLSLVVKVDAGAGGTTITNTASIKSANQVDYSTGNNTASVDIKVQSADLAVTKTVSNSAPHEGDTISYTVRVTNRGPDAATNVKITDLLPAGVTKLSFRIDSYSSDTGGYNSSTGVWTVGDLFNGAIATLVITVSVNSGTGSTTITNTASVTAVDQFDPNSGNNTASVDITVPGADLAITKTVSNPAPFEGTTFSYNLAITNKGSHDATDIQVTDILPAGVTYVVATPGKGSYNSGTGVWTVGTLDNGASATLTITARVNTGTFATTITNTASITASSLTDPDTTNNSASVDIVPRKEDLAVTKTVDNSTPGEGFTIVYTITVTNNGASTATGVRVTDTLPGGLTFVSSSPGQGTYSNTSGLWNVGSIPSRARATLTITVSTNKGSCGTSITNTAQITASDLDDYDATNNSSSVDIAVTGTNGTIGITNTVVPGGTLTVTVNDVDLNTNPAVVNTTVVMLRNNVTGETEQLTLTETGPNTGIFTGTLSTKPGTAAGTPNDGTFNAKYGDTITATYQDALTSTCDTATVTGTSFVLSPLMSLSKVVDKTAAKPGDILTYTLTYQNIGNGNARDVYFTDVIPANTTYVIGSTSGAGTVIRFQHIGGGSFDSSETAPVTAIMWTLSNPVPPGGSGTLTLRVRIE